MPTLLLQLIGPMQSWGTTSRFDQRDTGNEPSKSGVLGLIAAALGIDRDNWIDLEPLTKLSMGVRHDRPGIPKCDYQTAQNIIRANGKEIQPTAVTTRDYIADAAFLVGLESADMRLLENVHAALKNPVWPLSLGRKSYVPSEPIWIENGLLDLPLRDALQNWPWIATRRRGEKIPNRLRISFEADGGSGLQKMDQPLSSFAERRFGARFVRSDWIELPSEVQNAPA
ncbi:type I-E CRISPR-associated protein Cas5/CasD [Nitrincola sp. MINF-07-Sa-05]|uniref:type I-E CRISPR-associated protein Cas5/CasD n=1 Tax=Nitrincola salilacus TaxID=3400273 RepID=UPI0039182233